MRKSFLLTLCLILSPALALAQRPDFSPEVRSFIRVDAPVVALMNVTVIDGMGTPSRAGQTIVIEGDRIAAVGPVGEVGIPDGAEVMDLSGHTVLPGIIGLHDHTYYTAQFDESSPRLYLASGVTTIRTTGSWDPFKDINLKHAIAEGKAPGPTMFVTGPYLSGGGGMSNMKQLAGPDDARRVVAYWAEEGVDWFKVYTHIPHDALAAVIDEAHQHGIKVTGHLCSVTFREAVALGIDNIEHGLLTNTDYLPEKEPDACPLGFESNYIDLDLQGEDVQATFRVMVDAGVPMTSTLAVFEAFVPGRPAPEQRVFDLLPERFRESIGTMRAQMMDSGYAILDTLFMKAMAYEKAFVQAGGLLAAGVDPTAYGGVLPGYGDQRNYELLLEAGFTPVEVVEIMTANGARVLGIFDEVGAVTPGKRADLMVVDGDMEAHPETIRNVTMVFRQGVGYDPAKLIASVKEMLDGQ